MKKIIVGIVLILFILMFIILKNKQFPQPNISSRVSSDNKESVGVPLPEGAENVNLIISSQVSTATEQKQPISPKMIFTPESFKEDESSKCNIKRVNDIFKDYGKLWAYDREKRESSKNFTFSTSNGETIGNTIILYYTCQSILSGNFKNELEKYDHLNDDYKAFYLLTKYSTLGRGSLDECRDEIKNIKAYKNDPPILKEKACSMYTAKRWEDKYKICRGIGFEDKECLEIFPKNISNCKEDWCILTNEINKMLLEKTQGCPGNTKRMMGSNMFCGAIVTKNQEFCEMIGKKLINWYCVRKDEILRFQESEERLKKNRNKKTKLNMPNIKSQ